MDEWIVSKQTKPTNYLPFKIITIPRAFAGHSHCILRNQYNMHILLAKRTSGVRISLDTNNSCVGASLSLVNSYSQSNIRKDHDQDTEDEFLCLRQKVKNPKKIAPFYLSNKIPCFYQVFSFELEGLTLPDMFSISSSNATKLHKRTIGPFHK